LNIPSSTSIAAKLVAILTDSLQKGKSDVRNPQFAAAIDKFNGASPN